MTATLIDPRIQQMLDESNPSKIPDFAYFGDMPMGESWAWTVGTNRDADTLTRSNWEVITTDMKERFPDDTDIFSASHWACGWVDRLTVRVLDDEGEVTPAGEAVLEWADRVDNYPVADDDHFYNLEATEHEENVISEVRWRLRSVETDVDEDTIISRIFEDLNESSNGYDVTDDEIDEAIAYATNPDYRDPYHTQVMNGQLELDTRSTPHAPRAVPAPS